MSPATVPPPPKHGTRAIGARPRMSRFLRVLILVTVAIHVPAALAIVEVATRLALPEPWLVGAAYGVFGILLFAGRARAGTPDRRKHPVVVRLVDIPYFIHWCACIWTLVPSILFALGAPAFSLAMGEPVRVSLGFFMWLYASGLVIAAYGILIRRRWFHVQNLEIALPGLDPSFDGFRIAHLSDLHIGNTTPRAWGERWTRAANRNLPDIAVVTGDMVTSGTEFHDDIADVIGSLTARDGVFVSMGNHDYFGDGEPLIAKLGERGAKVLRNEGVVLARGDAKLYLAGIDDTWTKRDDIARALRARPSGATTILLAHDPERFPSAVKRDVELVLSGHTHGGQIAVPFLYRWLSLSSLTHHFNVGIYKKGRSTLYVHPGLGTTGPPMRLGVAPAVVMITLRAA